MATDLNKVRDLIATSRAAQNLPATLSDPPAVGRLADLFRLVGRPASRLVRDDGRSVATFADGADGADGEVTT